MFRIWSVFLFWVGLWVGGLSAQADEFKPRVVINRAFPAIKAPDIVSKSESNERVVRDQELVLGVVVNDEARAYPINTLTGPRREIINDRLGGQAIAATW